MTLLDNEGNPVDQIKQGDSVYFGADGLVPGELYTVTIKYPDGTEEQLNLSADEMGQIQPSAVLMYDTGLEIDPAELPAGRATGRMALAGGRLHKRQRLGESNTDNNQPAARSQQL